MELVDPARVVTEDTGGAEKSVPLERLHEDLLEVLKHQSETAKYQQEIRDRWFRFYLLAVGAAITLPVALVSLQGRQGAQQQPLPDLNTLLSFPLVRYSALLLAGLSTAFLILYLFQTINYHLNYLTIERVYEALNKLHSDTLIEKDLAQVFAYSYGRYPSLSINSRAEGTSRLRRLLQIAGEKRLLGADFAASSIYLILITSFLMLFAASMHWLELLSIWGVIGVGSLVLVALLMFRQLLMGFLFGYSVADFERRWGQTPSAVPSNVSPHIDRPVKSPATMGRATPSPVGKKAKRALVIALIWKENSVFPDMRVVRHVIGSDPTPVLTPLWPRTVVPVLPTDLAYPEQLVTLLSLPVAPLKPSTQ